MSIPTPVSAEVSITVGEEHLATSLRSGAVRVYATPAMIALMEAAAAEAVQPHLDDGMVSVGIQIAVEHLAATPPGHPVTARATLTAVDGRRLHYTVEAHSGETRIGQGTHTRVIVDRARFEARATASET